VRGRVPIQVRNELYEHPAAPVIRTVLVIYDQPERPLKLESFINVGDPQQRADFAALSQQEELRLLFYDEQLAHRLSKVVPNRAPEAMTEVLAAAERLRGAIAPERFNFDRAKAEVMRATRL
jgi:hypothetical protein